MPSGSSRSGLNSSHEDDDPSMEENVAHTASFARAKFNLSISLSKMTESETGCFIQPIEKGYPHRHFRVCSAFQHCTITFDHNYSFYDAKMNMV